MSSGERKTQRYGTIIVVGGGCYGSYYVRQLQRAASAGVLTASRLIVVDRNARCAATAEAASPIGVDIVVAEWRDFFDGYLAAAAIDPASAAGDAIVPSPLMPHLMGDWLMRRAVERFEHRVVSRPLDAVPDVPWERTGEDGTHFASFATWMCPINCVEPRTCPHTRGARTWSMPERLAEFAAVRTAAGDPVTAAAMFCRHRAYGVGMFDVAEVLDADARISAVGTNGRADVIVGTVSHCHGALTRFVIAAPASSPIG